MQAHRHCRAPFSAIRRSAATSAAKLPKNGIYVRRFHVDAPPVAPLRLPQGYRSLIPVVHECNNLILPHHPWDTDKTHVIATRTADGTVVDEEPVVPFLVSHSPHEKPIGFVRHQVASALEDDHQKHLVSDSASPWDFRYSSDGSKALRAIAFADWVNEGGKYTRTMHMERIVSDWKKHGTFDKILRSWSDEAYPVYIHPPNAVDSTHDPLAFAIERAALPLFSFVNFGALLIGKSRHGLPSSYVRDPVTGQIRIWVPRRSMHKRMWPGKLDVTVGGGMGLGDSAMQTIIRESAEEALLDQDYVEAWIRPVGVLPFPSRSPGGWALPGMYYLFDLPLPVDGSIIPRVNALDGEVDTFELVDAETVLQFLLEGQFKSSSAVAIMDFLMRHGYITEETDPRYLDVCRQLKTDFKLPVAWRPHL